MEIGKVRNFFAVALAVVFASLDSRLSCSRFWWPAFAGTLPAVARRESVLIRN